MVLYTRRYLPAWVKWLNLEGVYARNVVVSPGLTELHGKKVAVFPRGEDNPGNVILLAPCTIYQRTA